MRILTLFVVLTIGFAGTSVAQEGAPWFRRVDLPALREMWQHEPHRGAIAQLERWSRVPHGDERSDIERMQYHLGAFLALNDRQQGQRAVDMFIASMKDLEQWLPGVTGANTGQLHRYRYGQQQLVVYNVLREMDLLTDDQRAHARRVFRLFAERCMERQRGFNRQDYYSRGFRMGNHNTDRFIYVGSYALSFPDDPNSPSYLEHAITEVRHQLERSFSSDGLWYELTRYHGAVLRAYTPFAFGLRREKRIDLFDEPVMRKMFDVYILTLTPPDRTSGNVRLTPGVNDANWENYWTVFFAWGAKAYEKADPEFAGRLMWAWKEAGSPFHHETSPGSPLGQMFWIDPRIPAIEQPALTSGVYGFGFAILRHAFGTDDEHYLLASFDTSRKIWHEHFDRGGISLYAYRTPLLLDPGVRDYAKTRDEWFQLSKSHNLVQFDDQDVGDNATIDRFFDAGELAYLDMDLTKTVKGAYHRRIFRLDGESYLIWDAIDRPGRASYQLHVLGKESSATKQAVRFQCAEQVDLHVGTLWPEDANRQLKSDPYPVSFYLSDADRGLPGVARSLTPRWMSLSPRTESTDIVTLLHPMRREAAPPKGDAVVQSSGTKPRVVEVGATRGNWRILLGESKTLSGIAGAIRKLDGAPRESLYLIDGTKLVTDNGWGVQTDTRASILITPGEQPGRWNVRNLSGKPVTIDLLGLSPEQAEQAKVIQSDQAKIAAEHGASPPTFRWKMTGEACEIQLTPG